MWLLDWEFKSLSCSQTMKRVKICVCKIRRMFIFKK